MLRFSGDMGSLRGPSALPLAHNQLLGHKELTHSLQVPGSRGGESQPVWHVESPGRMGPAPQSGSLSSAITVWLVPCVPRPQHGCGKPQHVKMLWVKGLSTQQDTQLWTGSACPASRQPIAKYHVGFFKHNFLLPYPIPSHLLL